METGRGVTVDRGRGVFVGGAFVGRGVLVEAVPQAERNKTTSRLKRSNAFMGQIFLEY
jgi:hypothetical protein